MKVEDLNGRITKENIETLQKYVSKLLETSESVTAVDIGTLGGMSAIAVAVVSPKVTVHTMDPNHNPTIDEQIKLMGVEDQIHYYQMASEDWSSQCPDSIDFLFIDGQHNYAGVKSDLEKIGVKVRKGGYIIFHDNNLYNNTIGTAIKEFENVYYKFIEETGGSLEERQGSTWVGERI